MIRTEYFDHSLAKGVLIIFIYLDREFRSIDFSRSLYMALDRDDSYYHTLPNDLTPGEYQVFAYDIELDGTLHNGLSYPAATYPFIFFRNIQGESLSNL